MIQREALRFVKITQGDELTVLVKPVEGQSHRVSQADVFECFKVVSRKSVSGIPSKSTQNE